MTKSYWDFNVRVKNFSAKDVIDSRNFITHGNITYRNGDIKNGDIIKNDLNNMMMYNIEYMDIVSGEDFPLYNIVEWISRFRKQQYTISVSETDKKLLKVKIRIFDIDMAFKFKLQFYNYMEL